MSGLPLHPRLARLKPSLIREVFGAAPPGCLNMGLGQPDLPVPEALAQAAMASMAAGMAPYSPNAGLASLRQALGDMMATWAGQGARVGGWLTDPDGVIVTVGVEEGLFVALSALCGEGDEVLVPDPGFPAYEMIARCVGAEVRRYDCGPRHGFRPTAEAIARALGGRTRAVVLNSPGNPTGTVATPEDLEAIAALLDERGVPWVSDEIYDRYTYDGRPHASISAWSSRGVVLGGLSKTANMMGWRLGWMMAPAEAAPALTRVHQAVCTCAPTPAQAAAVAAARGLADGGPVAEAIAANVAVFAQRRDRAVAAVEALGLEHAPAQGAFYLLVDVRPHLPAGLDDLGLCMRMLQTQRLIAVPGQGFGPGGAGWVRLAYTSDAVEEGVARLGRDLGLA